MYKWRQGCRTREGGANASEAGACRRRQPLQALRTQLASFFLDFAFFRFFVCCFSRICSLLYFTCFRCQTSSSISSSKSSPSLSSPSSLSVSLILASDWLFIPC